MEDGRIDPTGGSPVRGGIFRNAMEQNRDAYNDINTKLEQYYTIVKIIVIVRGYNYL